MERTSACLYAAILALFAYCWKYEPQQPGKVVDETWQHALSEVKYKLHSSDLVNCTTLEEVEGLEFLASGWTKSVYKAMFRGRQVAVKTVNLNGQDMRACIEEPSGSLGSCYRRTAVKILKELILLTQLRHRNVIEVLGSCIPEGLGPVVVVTELGRPLDTVQLLQSSWQEKIKLALGVARVLHHLAHSSLGSLAMREVTSQQFVLADGELKLSDADDLEIMEPPCAQHTDCNPPRDPYNITDPEPLFCIRGRCDGHNERQNIIRAGQQVIRHFLPLRAPSSLEPHIKHLVDAYEGFGNWDSERILQTTLSLMEVPPVSP